MKTSPFLIGVFLMAGPFGWAFLAILLLIDWVNNSYSSTD
jgi:hypothetical protein